jgi:hypothetical protein
VCVLPRSRKRRSSVYGVVTQSEAKGSLVCVAVAVVIVAGLRREAGTTRPTNQRIRIGERGACDGARDSVYVPLCMLGVREECEGLWLLLCPKIVVNVR